jgi:phosphoadenosine phosphosulfate reductase
MSYTEALRIVTEYSIALSMGYALDKDCYLGQRTSMWDLIPQTRMPPTRLVRYCCNVLKEHGGTGRFITTGVRWAESTARKNNRGAFERSHRNKEKRIIINDNDPDRLLFENCSIKAKRVCNPIIDWEDEDVCTTSTKTMCR